MQSDHPPGLSPNTQATIQPSDQSTIGVSDADAAGVIGNPSVGNGGDADARGVVPNPHASEPSNIPGPTNDSIERMRRKMVAETMEMQDRFNGGLIGRQEGGV